MSENRLHKKKTKSQLRFARKALYEAIELLVSTRPHMGWDEWQRKYEARVEGLKAKFNKLVKWEQDGE